jgi:hypothetical protein
MYSKDIKLATYHYFDFQFHLESTDLQLAMLIQETPAILVNLISEWENFNQMMLNLERMFLMRCLLVRGHYLLNLIVICSSLRFEICFVQFDYMIWLCSKLLSQSKICFAFHSDFESLSWFEFKTGLMHYFGKFEIYLQSLMHFIHNH